MKYFSIFITILLFSNCESTKQTQENNPDAPYETILESDYGGLEAKSYRVIRSKSELGNELSLLNLDESTLNRLKTVDFKKQVVLSLHMGTRNTGGYGIKVSNVEINGNTTYVKIEEQSPNPDDMVTMALTQPFCLVVIDSNENIIFN